MQYETETHASICNTSGSKPSVFMEFLGHAQRVLKALDDRRKVRQLYSWSDADLKDIGVSRADVDHEATKPVRFW